MPALWAFGTLRWIGSWLRPRAIRPGLEEAGECPRQGTDDCGLRKGGFVEQEGSVPIRMPGPAPTELANTTNPTASPLAEAASAPSGASYL